MNVEVSLFGFGEDRPPSFGRNDRLELTLDQPATVADALDQAGFPELAGLSAMLNNALVPPRKWQDTPLSDGDALKVLLAIEGG